MEKLPGPGDASSSPKSDTTNGFSVHHLGVAVVDLDQAMAFYTGVFGLKLLSGPIEDSIQKVRACFLAEAGKDNLHLELVCPTDSESPVNGYLKKEIGAYHVCYEVNDIDQALRKLRKGGCLVISKPVIAVAYGGRKIAWCYTPTQQLVELLEREKSAA